MKGTIIFTWRRLERLYTEGDTELSSAGSIDVHYTARRGAGILGRGTCAQKVCRWGGMWGLWEYGWKEFEEGLAGKGAGKVGWSPIAMSLPWLF